MIKSVLFEINLNVSDVCFVNKTICFIESIHASTSRLIRFHSEEPLLFFVKNSFILGVGAIYYKTHFKLKDASVLERSGKDLFWTEYELLKKYAEK